MKKITPILVAIAIAFSGISFASTSITSSSVSGHWTVAGSPYLIYNHISIVIGSSLTIDPGVKVIFQGTYQLEVRGVLVASGTATQPIDFTINDTTGWDTDTATGAGGWLGVFFEPYAGTTPDISILNYCNVSRTKFCMGDYTIDPYISTLGGLRKLVVKNCNFFDNKTTPNGPSTLFYFNTYYASGLTEIINCSFHDNITTSGPCMMIWNSTSSSINFLGNKVYRNRSNCIIRCAYVNMLFEDNDVYDNFSSFGSGYGTTLSVDALQARIRRNKIHHNVSYSNGAVVCSRGFIDIDNNLICNNRHTNGFCGAVDGGGALNLTHNSPFSDDSTFYNVRNNIIANNYSPFRGGGIDFFRASANIVNNVIINNSSPRGGAMYIADGMISHAFVVKNNIIYGNISTADTPLTCIQGEGFCKYKFDHNYIDGSYSQILDLSPLGALLSGSDTSTNINGTNPGMSSPTLTADYTEDALAANFALLSTSACIDKGDNSIVSTGVPDFAGNIRIHNSTVDIGAHEYGSTILTLSFIPPVGIEEKINLYPNPAHNTINIVTPGNKGKIFLQDVTGKVFAETDIADQHTTIPVSHIPRGLYVVVYINDNSFKMTTKIVLQ